MKLFDIFISYRRTDGIVAEKLHDALVRRGQSVFWDKKSLENGKYGKDIETAISNCNNFILLVNDDTLDRCYSDPGDWITKEVSLALVKGKNIIPLFIGNSRSFPREMPEAIKGLSEYNGITRFSCDNTDCLKALFEVFLKKMEVFSTIDDFEIDDGILVKCLHQKICMTIPDGVKAIAKNAFSDCTVIKEMTLNPDLTLIDENAFYRCISLEYIDMPRSLKIIAKRAFYRCQHLKAVNLSTSIERIEEQAFAFCNSIKTIELDEGLRFIDVTAFEDCSSLVSIFVENTNPFYSSAEGILYDKNRTTLIKCPALKSGVIHVPNTVHFIGKYSFLGSQIDKLVFDGPIEEIDKYAFLDSSISEIVYHFDRESVKVNKLAFLECMNLKSNPFLMAREDNVEEDKYIKDHLVLYEYIMIKTSFESEEEAYNMIKMLLDRKLIVSGQVSEHRAIYQWNGAISDEKEIEMLCFTRGALYEEVEHFILQHHAYECPEILCFPVINTSISFGKWINEGTLRGVKDE